MLTLKLTVGKSSLAGAEEREVPRMSKLLRGVVVVALAAAAVTAVSSGPVAAAPVKKGETTISSPLLELGPLLGIEGQATGPARRVGNDFVMPVVGNPENGTLMHVGGILLTKSNGQTLSFESTHMDLETLQVSAVVNGNERVVIYQGERIDGQTVFLRFTPQGAAIVRPFINFFGIPEDWGPFGWATTTAEIPEEYR
jgi:hypothetical protein